MKKNYLYYKTRNYEVKSINFEQIENMKDLLSTTWNVYKKNTQDVVGSYKFSGAPVKGCIKLEYDFAKIEQIEELELIFSYLLKWAFKNKDVYSVECLMPQTKINKSIYDFAPYKKEFQTDTDTAIFRVKKTDYLSYYITFSIIIGISSVFVIDSLIFGIAVAVIGCSIGFIIDSKERAYRIGVEGKIKSLHKK